MTDQRHPMLIPALVGGAIAGFLTAVPIVNCFCCIWIIGGGMIAAYMLSRSTKVPLTPGDGAIVGIFSGIVAAIVDAVISIPFQAMTNELFRNIMERVEEYSDELPAGWDKFLERASWETSVTWSLIGLLVAMVLFSIMGALGGILGVSFFKKKQPPQNEVIDVPKK